MKNLTIHCLGPLLPASQAVMGTPKRPTTESVSASSERNIWYWLDGQAKDSVIYVSFGTMASPSAEQVTVLAEALLQSGRPFIWTLAKHVDALPEAIREKMSDPKFDAASSQFLVLSWVPQARVLQHAAVAVFLSHAGWNGCLEGLAAGKPFVVWPLMGDQWLNAEWIAGTLGAGVRIAGTGLRGERLVPGPEIVAALEEVTGGLKGMNGYKNAAQRWAGKLRTVWDAGCGGSCARELEDFLTVCGKGRSVGKDEL